MLGDLTITVDGEGVLLLFVKQFPQGLTQQVVDFPVTEEQIICSKQLSFFFDLLELFSQFRVADNLLQHGGI